MEYEQNEVYRISEQRKRRLWTVIIGFIRTAARGDFVFERSFRPRRTEKTQKVSEPCRFEVMDALEAVIVSAGVNSADKVKVPRVLVG